MNQKNPHSTPRSFAILTGPRPTQTVRSAFLRLISQVLSPSSDVLLVLGLPQCGTDTVSHVLERCGARAGLLSELADAQRELLTAVGSSWDSPLELPERCLNGEAARRFTSTLTTALQEQDADQCGLACVHGMERILPLWQAALISQDRHIRHLLVVRHPLAVVEQFRNSQSWDRDRALLVWLQSALAMERHSRHSSRVVVDSEQLTWDLEGTLNLIETTLQLTLPDRHHKSLIELERESGQVAPSSTSITTHTNPTAGSLLLTMALQLHDWLLAESQNRERQRHLPDAIRQQLALAESLMGRTMNELSLRNSDLKNKLQSLGQRRSLRFSNWLRRQASEAA